MIPRWQFSCWQQLLCCHLLICSPGIGATGWTGLVISIFVSIYCIIIIFYYKYWNLLWLKKLIFLILYIITTDYLRRVGIFHIYLIYRLSLLDPEILFRDWSIEHAYLATMNDTKEISTKVRITLDIGQDSSEDVH